MKLSRKFINLSATHTALAFALSLLVLTAIACSGEGGGTTNGGAATGGGEVRLQGMVATYPNPL